MKPFAQRDASGGRAALWALLAILSASAFGLYLWQIQAPSRQIVTFPNGMQARFVGVRAGGSQFSTGKPWDPCLRTFLPPRWLGPSVSGSCGSGSNVLSVYLDVSMAPGQNMPWDSYWAEGEDGFVYPREGGICSFGGPPQVYGLTFRALPRRQKTFWVCFGDQDGKELGRVRVPNLFPGPFPSWSPQPLPQTQTNGPVSLTLKSGRAKGAKSYRYLQPEWQLISTDPLWAKAAPGYCQIQDATGNQANWLNPAEKAWKVITMVHRKGYDSFRAEERLVISNLSLPEPGKFIALNATGRIAGVTIDIPVLTGAGKLTISNGITSISSSMNPSEYGHSSSSGSFGFMESWDRDRPFLLIVTHGMQAEDELRCRLLDQQGRTVVCKNESYSGDGRGNRSYTPLIDGKPATGPLSLELVVSRPLAFEFLIDPSAIATNSIERN
jgi:hypothetical protein